jgi:hypothetical protein
MQKLAFCQLGNGMPAVWQDSNFWRPNTYTVLGSLDDCDEKDETFYI